MPFALRRISAFLLILMLALMLLADCDVSCEPPDPRSPDSWR